MSSATGVNESDQPICWLRDPRPTSAACLVCGNVSGNRVVLTARHWDASRGRLDFALCGSCGSGFYCDTDAHRDYPVAAEDKFGNPEFVLLLYHYLEFACGISSIVGLLERSPFEGARSFLEIGCNMGVGLDYVVNMWGVDAVGLEPSAYGLGGRKLLGVPIVSAYLDDAPEVSSCSFDVVFASEVLEHVHAPIELLASMRRSLSKSGYLLITTPTIDAVSRERPQGEVLGALSAGAHYFVASRRGLALLLHESGFDTFHIGRIGPSHSAIAGPGAHALARPRRNLSARLHAYYQRRIQLPSTDPRVELAFVIHAYDAGVEARATDSVRSLEPKIDRLLRDVFDVSLHDVGALASRVVAATNLFALGRAIPYSLPRHLRARAARLAHADPARGELHAAAALIAAHGVRLDLQNLAGYVRLHRRARASARLAVVTGAATPTALALLQQSEGIRQETPALAGRGWAASALAESIEAGVFRVGSALARARRSHES